MNYFNDICAYICNKLYKLFGIKIKIISGDKRNIRITTNNKTSESINIYRITSQNDLDTYIDLIGHKLIKSF